MQPGEVLVGSIGSSALRHYRSDGSLVAETTLPATALLLAPALLPDGRWVSYDRNANTIEYFAPDGTAQGSQQAPQVQAARDIAIFADGTLAIADLQVGDIKIYSATGAFVQAFDPQGMGRILGLLVDSENTLWATDIDLNRLWRFDIAGNVLTTISTSTMAAGDVDEASDGTLWAISRDTGNLLHYAKNGMFLGGCKRCSMAEPESRSTATEHSGRATRTERTPFRTTTRLARSWAHFL